MKAISFLLKEFDSYKDLSGLAMFLNRHSEKKLIDFIDTFPLSELKIDYSSIEKDFRNCQRMEMMLYLASILLRWEDYCNDPLWQGLLPKNLNATILYTKLSKRLLEFIESNRGTDIAAILRTKLYDFAMDLIRKNKNKEAAILLEISKPSLREDHDFWLCACYYNIGQVEKDVDIINRGIKLAEELMEGSNTPSIVKQRIEQIDLLGKLQALSCELKT